MTTALAESLANPHFPADEFVTVRRRPIFTTHETTSSSGRKMVFTERELAGIVKRCNDRVRQTGDAAAICKGHTLTKQEIAQGGQQPPVVGYANNFALGEFGGRPAVFADLHIFREDATVLKTHPRVSVELWLEEDLAQCFFDPICLLSSETPRLDLGLTYCAKGQCGMRQPEVYRAAGPTLFALPSERNEDMEFSTDQIRMIVDALEELDWVVWIRNKMQEEKAHGEPSTGTEQPEEEYQAAHPGPHSSPPATDGGDRRKLEPYERDGEVITVEQLQEIVDGQREQIAKLLEIVDEYKGLARAETNRQQSHGRTDDYATLEASQKESRERARIFHRIRNGNNLSESEYTELAKRFHALSDIDGHKIRKFETPIDSSKKPAASPSGMVPAGSAENWHAGSVGRGSASGGDGSALPKGSAGGSTAGRNLQYSMEPHREKHIAGSIGNLGPFQSTPEQRSQAFAICEKEAIAGRPVDYLATLEKIVAA